VLGSGLQIIAYTSLIKNDALGKEVVLQTTSGKIPVWVHPALKKEKGLIITFTGFSVHGFKDKRVAAMNNAYAKMGYTAVTPQINTIDALQIHPNAIDEVKNAIFHIVASPILNPKKHKPAVFAPSFTAGIAALAVAEMPPESILSLCLLGTYTDFESTIQFALRNPNQTDDYGMHILLKNFLPYDIGKQSDLEDIIQAALEDNGLKRTEPMLPNTLKKANVNTQKLYHTIKNDAALREEMVLRAWKKIPDFAQFKNRLDLAQHAHKITCVVSIIHGKDDDVIPASQSMLLYDILKAHKQDVRLEVSNLLSHGDPKFGIKILAEVFNLAKAFAYFLPNHSKK